MSFFALLPSPPKHPKIRILKKWEKIAGDIIILHQSTKNHMMYSSWDTEWERQKKFDILGHFLPFYPPNNQENQNKKKMKKKMKKASVRCHHFTHVYQKLQSYDRAVSRIWIQLPFFQCPILGIKNKILE